MEWMRTDRGLLRGPGCSSWIRVPVRAGVGQKADKAYAASEPVRAALQEFRDDHDAYPPRPAALVPDYLLAVWSAGDELDYSYSTTHARFSFPFHYLDPRMNTCACTP